MPLHKYLFQVCLLMAHSIAWGQMQEDPAFSLPQVQDQIAIKYANTITESDLRNYLNILASDALEGRETGSRGQKMAAAFIREHFIESGLKPIVNSPSDSSYFQDFKLYKTYYQQVYLEANQKKYHHLTDLLYFGDAGTSGPKEIMLHFVGNGEESDYRDLDVTNSMVAFYIKSRAGLQRKVKIGKSKGATAFLLVNNMTRSEFEQYREKYGHYFGAPSISESITSSGSNLFFQGHPELLSELLGTELEKINSAMEKSATSSSKNPLIRIKPSEITMIVEKKTKPFSTENVLGFVEGSDKPGEVIVLTAHYDHEGLSGDQVFNGADDDGSGTAAIMELAQAFAQAKAEGNGPRRSLLFMTVTGEEKGLLGSDYYVRNPALPLENTVANLNIDMIGRVDPNHQGEQEEYLYIIGSDRLSLDLHRINEQMNDLYTKLILDYTYNSPDDPNRFYYRSDHYNFAKHNIPIIFYFNGTHADYHKPTDTVDKIRFDLLKKRTDLIFFTTWELANRENRIRLN